jgi:hypothetical protein
MESSDVRHVEVAVVLPGEGGAGQVFQGGGGAHRDARPAQQRGEALAQRALQLPGERGGAQAVADGLAARHQPRGVGGAQRGHLLLHPLHRGEEEAVRRGGDHDARRHGEAAARQPGEARPLPPRLRGLGGERVSELE